jgi:hypothetical protein
MIALHSPLTQVVKGALYRVFGQLEVGVSELLIYCLVWREETTTMLFRSSHTSGITISHEINNGATPS